MTYDDALQDHLGDLTPEHSDPYPATQEAWARSTVELPRDVYADPDDVRQDVAQYAAAPYKIGTAVRDVSCPQWVANGFILNDGAQAFGWIANDDPYRRSVTIWNHSTGPIYISPNDTQQIGPGTLMIPGRDTDGSVHSRELRTTQGIYLFTVTGFTAGAQPIHVSIYAERYG